MAAPARVNVCGTKACVGLVLPPGTPVLEEAMVCRLLHWLLPDTEFETNPSPIEASFLPFDVYGNAGARRRGGLPCPGGGHLPLRL